MSTVMPSTFRPWNMGSQVTDAAGKNYLVPAIRDVVVRVDLEGEKLELRPMEGIFDDAD